MRYVSYRSDARQGLTLVEVVAGITLLALLLVSVLTVYRAHALQIRHARERMAAIRIADELLSDWLSGAGLPKVGEQAALPQTPGWSWRIVRIEPNAELWKLGASTIRLEIVTTSESAPSKILTTVELLVSETGGTSS